MTIFEELSDMFDNIKMPVDEISQVAIEGAIDKLDEAMDVVNRRAEIKYKQIDEAVDTLNALFGLDEYKDTSIKERFETVFAVKDTSIKTCAEYGDIIGVDRGGYKHYGIYIGNNRVIHYAGSENDFLFDRDIRIREDDISRFLDKEKSYFVFDCENKGNHKFKINLLAPVEAVVKAVNIFSLFDFTDPLVVFSPEEAVDRARSKMGEDKYNLALNNCEHFAIWCKTGISKSTQVDDILNVLVPVIIPIPFKKIL